MKSEDWNSPITVIEEITQKITHDKDEHIFEAVLSEGISVDRDELSKALRYDRDQYYKGYIAGKTEALREGYVSVVRCRDCDNTDIPIDEEDEHDYWCMKHGSYVCEDDFCSYGERRNDKDD